MSQCLSKMVYKDLEVAERVAKNYTETNYQGRTFRVYTCKVCGHMHLSSKKLRKR